jgi:broad specificity phosphatase PhoE
LTQQGLRQARAIGPTLRALKIPPVAIRNSESCRARQTAVLLGMGEVTTDEGLNPVTLRNLASEYAQQLKFLFEKPPAGNYFLLVYDTFRALKKWSSAACSKLPRSQRFG